MGSDTMPNKRTALILVLLAFVSRPAFAQVDLTGEWSPRVYNTHMDIGDYTGIPVNEPGRLRAESWHPDQLDRFFHLADASRRPRALAGQRPSHRAQNR